MSNKTEDMPEELWVMEPSYEAPFLYPASRIKFWKYQGAKRYTRTPTTPQIPEGWALVPIEPIKQMLIDVGCMEGYDGANNSADNDHIEWWQAMIAAAPHFKQQNGKDKMASKAIEALDEFIKECEPFEYNGQLCGKYGGETSR